MRERERESEGERERDKKAGGDKIKEVRSGQDWN